MCDAWTRVTSPRTWGMARCARAHAVGGPKLHFHVWKRDMKLTDINQNTWERSRGSERYHQGGRQEYFGILSDVTTLCRMLKVSCSLCSSASREHLASSTADRAAETLGGTKLDTVRTWKAKQNCLHFILKISELHDCVNFLQTRNSITVCKCASYTSE